MRLILAALLLCCATGAFSQSASLTVVMIRHGEKNDSTGNLSCQGFNRSLLLADTLPAKFPRPSHVYVPTVSKGKMTNHARMFQTITPYAVKYNLKLDSNYPESADSALAKDILTKTGLVLVVWEHTNIPGIAKYLGVPGEHTWHGQDFDTIWIVTFTKSNGKWVANLDKKHKEGITPSPTCN